MAMYALSLVRLALLDLLQHVLMTLTLTLSSTIRGTLIVVARSYRSCS